MMTEIVLSLAWPLSHPRMMNADQTTHRECGESVSKVECFDIGRTADGLKRKCQERDGHKAKQTFTALHKGKGDSASQ